MDLGPKIEKGHKLTKEQKDALSKAFAGREGETSAFQKKLLKAQDGLAKLGAGILGAIVNTGQYIVAAFTKFFGHGDEKKKKAEKDMIMIQATITDNWEMMGNAMKEIGGAGGDMLKTVIFNRETNTSGKPRIPVVGDYEMGTGATDAAGWVGYRKSVVDEARVRSRDIMASLTTDKLTQALTGKVSPDDMTALLNTYSQTERKTGHGEAALRDEIRRRKLKGVNENIGFKLEQESGEQMVYGKDKTPVRLKVIVQAVGDESYNGKVENG
jgi:hypothetical protein